MKLILVESPTKAKTLTRFLKAGKDLVIEATYGHIRDLPEKKLGVNTRKDFEPEYVIPKRQTKKVSELKKLARVADSIILATDPDREGEAIAYHAAFLLKKKGMKIERIVFHEITKSAIDAALKSPKEIDQNLVDAQQARRVLDRLVGYKLSPLLWRKVRAGLSAGRVQSVTVRLVVDREKERDAFKPVEFWVIEVEVETTRGDKFKVILDKIDGGNGEVNNQKDANLALAELRLANYIIFNIERKAAKRSPNPPFTTSTLQQAAVNRLGWSSKKTMMHAQKLYEQGLITYHRTDSLSISAEAVTAARVYIEKEYGKNYLVGTPRLFKTKSKVAQEAHEAIRPTNVSKKKSGVSPDSTKFGRDDARLYDLIWSRFVATQMESAIFDRTKIEVEAIPINHSRSVTHSPGVKKYVLIARGEILKFDGYLKVIGISKSMQEGVLLPEVSQKESLKLINVDGEQKFTQPPARFSESSLIKKLESEGVGRPSTYAPIISNIQDRHYIEKAEGRFSPTKIGITVTDFLVEHFPAVLDLKFTASMEDSLDEIANGRAKWKQVIGTFYEPFKNIVNKVQTDAEKVKIPVEKTGRRCPDCKTGDVIIRIGRFGKFLSCDKFPECKYTKNYMEKVGIDCPKCGGEIIVRRTKRGKQFFGCSTYPDCDYAAWKKTDIGKEPATKAKNGG